MSTVIRDKLINPYEIHIDGESFTAGIPVTDKKGNTSLSHQKYFSNLSNVLRYIAKKSTAEEKIETDLTDFILRFENKLDQFMRLIKV